MLVLAVTELIFFIVSITVLCFGFVLQTWKAKKALTLCKHSSAITKIPNPAISTLSSAQILTTEFYRNHSPITAAVKTTLSQPKLTQWHVHVKLMKKKQFETNDHGSVLYLIQQPMILLYSSFKEVLFFNHNKLLSRKGDVPCFERTNDNLESKNSILQLLNKGCIYFASIHSCCWRLIHDRDDLLNLKMYLLLKKLGGITIKVSSVKMNYKHVYLG